MRVFVIYAHPVETSYNAALHRAAIDGLKAAGHDVDDCDLYAEGFDPVMSRQDRIDYHDETINTKPVQQYVDRLRAAEAIVLSCPIWNYGYPAMLKGFTDRVFLPGVSFTLQNGVVKPNLWHVKKIAAIHTYGGTRFRTFLMGDAPRKQFKRTLRALVHPLAKQRYLALYDMNRNSEPVLKAFLARVSEEMRRF
ncbi:MAG TPA: NAD(P)H-dependent oxidoreductase [Bauldia sp.]|nr:NAD(P)H-dependent oxidoreductase [Bauldia sp.]